MSEDQTDRHQDPELGEPVSVRTPTWQRLYEFHGHVGPYVTLGFRAGEIAREILESPGYFDLTAEVASPLETPQSCFIDGVQLGSGCTAGKRNLMVREGDRPGVLFQTKSGKSIRIEILPDLPERIRAWIDSDGLEATARKILELPHEKIFNVSSLDPKKQERP